MEGPDCLNYLKTVSLILFWPKTTLPNFMKFVPNSRSNLQWLPCTSVNNHAHTNTTQFHLPYHSGRIKRTTFEREGEHLLLLLAMMCNILMFHFAFWDVFPCIPPLYVALLRFTSESRLYFIITNFFRSFIITTINTRIITNKTHITQKICVFPWSLWTILPFDVSALRYDVVS